jgi:Fe-S-cluster containining protein
MTIPDEDIEPEINKVSDEEEPQEKAPKFKFECQRTGDCCKRENIPVSVNDLQAWVSDQTILRVAYFIELVVEDDEPQLQLTKDDDGYCKLYHRDNKACSIQYNKPRYCKSYPLGYNGENYVIVNQECSGLGKGKMTKESLKDMREHALADHRARRLTADILPIFQGIFYRQLAEESKKFMDKLSPEEKEKFDDLLKKEKKE